MRGVVFLLLLVACGRRHGFSITTEEVLDKIYTEKVIDAEENLVHRLLDLEELLAHSERGGCPVKVLIVDSIAYPFRDVDYTVPALQRRSTFFFGISSILRYCQLLHQLHLTHIV
jgi:hypothetical protein